MSTTQPAPALDAPEVFQFVRSSNSFLETAEIRKLLKQNLGYNSKQVSVSARHSIQYVSIKVRKFSARIVAIPSRKLPPSRSGFSSVAVSSLETARYWLPGSGYLKNGLARSNYAGKTN